MSAPTVHEPTSEGDGSNPVETAEQLRVALRSWLAEHLTADLVALDGGMPTADTLGRLRAWNRVLADAGWAAPAWPRAEGDAVAVMEMAAFLDDLAKRKAAAPGEDLLSMLVSAEVEGHALTPCELVTFSMSLVVAGNETTRHLMSGSLLELSAHPDQREAIYDEPDRIPGAIEERLRWVTPIQQFARTATGDTELSGEPVSEGDYLVMVYASGNRDERAFGPTAGAFDTARPARVPNLGLGFGQHLCLGAALARLEAIRAPPMRR